MKIAGIVKGLLSILMALFILAITRPVNAQVDEVVIHFDKSFYVTGEIAWFTLYLPNNFANKEIAVNTAVLDGRGQQLERFFLRTEGKTSVNGYYKIPYESETGFFEFQFRTSKGGQNPDMVFAYFSLPVYNDLANISNVNLTNPKAGKQQEQEVDLKVAISLTTSIIKSRDQIAANIQVVNAAGQPVKGHLSATVTDKSLCHQQGVEYASIQKMEIPNELNLDLIKDLLKNNIYVQGKLGDAENPQQANVLGGYSGTDDRMFYSKSFEDGFFSMKFPDFYGRKRIQFIGYQKEQAEISSQVDIATKIGSDPQIVYTAGVLDYLKFSRMRKKILQYFDAVEFSLNPEIKKEKVRPTEPDLVFEIKEYESFPDMKGFFGEIITTLSFKLEKDSTYSAALYNPKERKSKNTNLKGTPLFIIDGKVTRNADFVANLSMGPVQTVEIYTTADKLREYYLAMGTSGVVKIKTNLLDIKMTPTDAEDLHTIYGFLPTVDFQSSNMIDTRQPYFKPLIYWNPSMATDEQGEANLSFIQSDDMGDFQIEVLFQSEDGRYGYGSLDYQVKL